MRRFLALVIFSTVPFLLRSTLCAQTSDVVMMQHLSERGVKMYDGNSVKLLKTGHDKFIDLFEAVREAKSFIHLEYFNFRNDSIAGLLFHLLAQKVEEGVEVRALYDAFGNSSNNKPICRQMHDSICSLGIQLVKFDPIRSITSYRATIEKSWSSMGV